MSFSLHNRTDGVGKLSKLPLRLSHTPLFSPAELPVSPLLNSVSPPNRDTDDAFCRSCGLTTSNLSNRFQYGGVKRTKNVAISGQSPSSPGLFRNLDQRGALCVCAFDSTNSIAFHPSQWKPSEAGAAKDFQQPVKYCSCMCTIQLLIVSILLHQSLHCHRGSNSSNTL